MAAITTTNLKGAGHFRASTTSAATIDTWLLRPAWANHVHIVLSITSLTTSLALSVLEADPVRLDDTFVTLIKETAAFTGLTTSTATYVIDIGPGMTPADDVTIAAAADSYAAINVLLPDILGIRQVNTGSNVYTLSTTFRP